MIRGECVTLHPATLDDRRRVFEWGHDSDLAGFIYPPGSTTQTFEDFCADWKEHYFTDESPNLGRVFLIFLKGSPVGMVAYNAIDPKNRVELDIWMSCEVNLRYRGSWAIRCPARL